MIKSQRERARERETFRNDVDFTLIYLRFVTMLHDYCKSLSIANLTFRYLSRNSRAQRKRAVLAGNLISRCVNGLTLVAEFTNICVSRRVRVVRIGLLSLFNCTDANWSTNAFRLGMNLVSFDAGTLDLNTVKFLAMTRFCSNWQLPTENNAASITAVSIHLELPSRTLKLFSDFSCSSVLLLFTSFIDFLFGTTGTTGFIYTLAAR